MSYTCDCGYIIQDSADEQKHLKEIHASGWTPKNRPKVKVTAEVPPEPAKQSTATTKTNPTTTKKK